MFLWHWGLKCPQALSSDWEPCVSSVHPANARRLTIYTPSCTDLHTVLPTSQTIHTHANTPSYKLKLLPKEKPLHCLSAWHLHDWMYFQLPLEAVKVYLTLYTSDRINKNVSFIFYPLHIFLLSLEGKTWIFWIFVKWEFAFNLTPNTVQYCARMLSCSFILALSH